jgi:excisionase family DNA binding protein
MKTSDFMNLKNAFPEYFKKTWGGDWVKHKFNPFYTKQEVAELLMIGEQKVLKLVKEGKFTARREGQQYRFLKTEVQNYLNSIIKEMKY